MSKLVKYPSLSHLSGIVKALKVGGGSHENRDLEGREQGKKAGYVLTTQSLLGVAVVITKGRDRRWGWFEAHVMACPSCCISATSYC